MRLCDKRGYCIIMPVGNQADEGRRTVASTRNSFRDLRLQLDKNAVRTEEEFFSTVLGIEFPVKYGRVHA